MTRLLLAFLLVQSAVQTQAPAPAGQLPANVTPGAPEAPLAPAAADPAAVTFTSDFGMVLVAVKAVGVADYEAAIVALQEALSKSEDEATRTLARSWRVLKAAEADAKTNALYIHLLEPPVPSVDYRPSLWLDKLLAGAPPDLLAKYRDAFAGPPTKLGLVEFANMAVAPVPKPTNATPGAPTAPGKPGNVSPGKPGNVSPGKPGNVSPAKPGNVSPAAPENLPGKPENVSPAKPGNVAPAKPGNVSPAKPGNVSPAKPGNVSPANPGNVSPIKPPRD